jgi:hypothetical protein
MGPLDNDHCAPAHDRWPLAARVALFVLTCAGAWLLSTGLAGASPAASSDSDVRVPSAIVAGSVEGLAGQQIASIDVSLTDAPVTVTMQVRGDIASPVIGSLPGTDDVRDVSAAVQDAVAAVAPGLPSGPGGVLPPGSLPPTLPLPGVPPTLSFPALPLPLALPPLGTVWRSPAVLAPASPLVDEALRMGAIAAAPDNSSAVPLALDAEPMVPSGHDGGASPLGGRPATPPLLPSRGCVPVTSAIAAGTGAPAVLHRSCATGAPGSLVVGSSPTLRFALTGERPPTTPD